MNFQKTRMDKYKTDNISFFLLPPRWSAGARVRHGRRCAWTKKVAAGRGEEGQGRGPHRQANGADAEELYSGSSEGRGNPELGRSGAALRRWRGCSARHWQVGEQASTVGASVIAPVSSVWRAPDGALGPVELGDGKQRGRQTSSGFDEVKKEEEASAVCPCPGEKARSKGGLVAGSKGWLV
jgi:hypothetical protein